MNPAPQAPSRETPATLRDIITVKSALAGLLAEEATLMDTMQMGRVGALQDRKLKLTGMLERYMRYIKQHPQVVADVSLAEKAELVQVSEEFQKALKKNYDTLLVARAVNGAIVKCVTQVVSRRDTNPVYNAKGATKAPYRPSPISMTLNETV